MQNHMVRDAVGARRGNMFEKREERKFVVVRRQSAELEWTQRPRSQLRLNEEIAEAEL